MLTPSYINPIINDIKLLPINTVSFRRLDDANVVVKHVESETSFDFVPVVKRDALGKYRHLGYNFKLTLYFPYNDIRKENNEKSDTLRKLEALQSFSDNRFTILKVGLGQAEFKQYINSDDSMYFEILKGSLFLELGSIELRIRPKVTYTAFLPNIMNTDYIRFEL